ncbi:MAG TPA: hypothetical protein VJ206_01780 [bacterium]|nr:hypothetical protein [bacterium]
MGEPARKLDPDLVHPQPRMPRAGRRARVLPLRQREDAQQPEDAWVLDQIVLWYRTRRD